MPKTIIGVFRNSSEAQSVMEELLERGFSRVQMHSKRTEQFTRSTGAGAAGAAMAIYGTQPDWHTMDISEEERDYYTRKLSEGNALLLVETEDDKAEFAGNIMTGQETRFDERQFTQRHIPVEEEETKIRQEQIDREARIKEEMKNEQLEREARLREQMKKEQVERETRLKERMKQEELEREAKVREREIQLKEEMRKEQLDREAKVKDEAGIAKETRAEQLKREAEQLKGEAEQLKGEARQLKEEAQRPMGRSGRLGIPIEKLLGKKVAKPRVLQRRKLQSGSRTLLSSGGEPRNPKGELKVLGIRSKNQLKTLLKREPAAKTNVKIFLDNVERKGWQPFPSAYPQYSYFFFYFRNSSHKDFFQTFHQGKFQFGPHLFG